MLRLFRVSLTVTVLCLVASWSSPAPAGIPNLLAWQGVALDSLDAPLADGDYNIHFAIYNDPTAGDSLWGESHLVTIENGVINVLLGTVIPVPDSVFAGPSTFLQVQFESEDPYVPRSQILSVGYAFRVGTIDGATGGSISGPLTVDDEIHSTSGGIRFPDNSVQTTAATGGGGGWVDDGTEVRLETATDKVGIGTATPLTRLHILLSQGEGLPANAAAHSVLISNNASPTQDAGLGIVAGTDGRPSIFFGDSLSSTRGAIRYENSTQNMRFLTNSIFRMALTGSGSLGIGLDDPAEKLDVVGNIHASGSLISGNSITIDGSNDRITASSGTLELSAGHVVATGKATIGAAHTNTGNLSSICGGAFCSISGDWATISGGNGNSAISIYTTVSGGAVNHAGGNAATVGGGFEDTASADYSTVGGGRRNTASGQYATVAGGFTNLASFDAATASGGHNNSANGPSSTVGGGGFNIAQGSYSVVGGGGGPTVSDTNSATGITSTIAGGRGNTASALNTTVSGGGDNIASGIRATVGGGGNNTASMFNSTVSGGTNSAAIGIDATVGGGNTDTASGTGATVPGGLFNTASGLYSFAAGRQAKAIHDGAFVWADNLGADIASVAKDQFVVRAVGGVWFGATSSPTATAGRFIETSTGGYLTDGGTWTNSSDKNLKENFVPINGQELLDKISTLSISKWNYKAESEDAKHIGPTAQDFYEHFGLGNDDKAISTIDPAGIALAAIQELYRKTQEIDELRSELEELRSMIKRALNDGPATSPSHAVLSAPADASPSSNDRER